MWYCTDVRQSRHIPRQPTNDMLTLITRYYLWKINHTYDTSWTGFNLFVWALLECHLAIIFACAPSLRAFMRRYLGETFRSTFRSSNNRSRNRTNDGSHNTSTLNSSAFADPEAGKMRSTVEQQVIEKPSETELWSAGSGGARSSFTITNPDEYEAYNMRQLSKHGYRRRDTSEDIAHDYNDPKRTHHVLNAVSSLPLVCPLYLANSCSSVRGLTMGRLRLYTTMIPT